MSKTKNMIYNYIKFSFLSTFREQPSYSYFDLIICRIRIKKIKEKSKIII